VAATVNDEPISSGEVRTGMQVVLQGRQVAPATVPLVEAEVLAQLIDRRLVEGRLRKAGLSMSADQVAAAAKQMRLQMEQQKVVWQDYLNERHLTEAAFKEQLAWNLIWDKFLQSQLTDAILESYFDAHHQDYDGTEMRVSHLLLRPQRSAHPEEAARLIERARQLREDISSGKITFEAAVKKYSAGPSREHGGDLGFIPRHGLMLEPFSQAAFQLKPGELSQPLITPFGVHLIRAEEIKPGSKKWVEVRDQLRKPASQELYNEIAHEERSKAKITFTGAMPHFKPGTKELAESKAPPPGP
jgi:parvulin-like peptidyl-prolyl isomerase